MGYKPNKDARTYPIVKFGTLDSCNRIMLSKYLIELNEVMDNNVAIVREEDSVLYGEDQVECIKVTVYLVKKPLE